MYSINRTTALALEQHLAQYGYQQPAGAVLEPETLHDNYLLQDDNQGGLFGGVLSGIILLAV